MTRKSITVYSNFHQQKCAARAILGQPTCYIPVNSPVTIGMHGLHVYTYGAMAVDTVNR